MRDLLHVDHLLDLLDQQLCDPAHWDGTVVNVGGGRERSRSLQEATALCAEMTGHRVEVIGAPTTRPGDVPVYISDCHALSERTTCALGAARGTS